MEYSLIKRAVVDFEEKKVKELVKEFMDKRAFPNVSLRNYGSETGKRSRNIS